MRLDDVRDLNGLSDEDREILAHLLRESRVDEIVRDDRRSQAPLSFSQQRLWAVDQLGHATSAYNLWVAFRLTGALDCDALERSLSEIVRRHAVLRTTFQALDGQLSQQVRDELAITIARRDFRDAPADERMRVATNAAFAETEVPFDLSSGPLLRAVLLQLCDDEHLFVITMHHIVSDGWSMDVLFGELAALYDAFRHGRPSPLPELPVQYSDYACWQRERLQGAMLDDLLAYWRGHLSGVPATELPAKGPRAATPSTGGAHEQTPIPEGLLTIVDRIAREEGATRYMVLASVFLLLLSRYTGQRDVTVGMPIAGRERRELEYLIGLFVNVMPLCARVDSRVTFRALVRHVRDRALEAVERQSLPFDLLVESLNVERSFDRHPVFQIVFGAQDRFETRLSLGDLHVEPVQLPTLTTRFDVEAHVLETNGVLQIGLIYRTELFAADSMRSLLTRYVALLEACAGAPDAPLSATQIVTRAERDQLVRMWNATGAEYPREATVTQLVERQARIRPNDVAVVCGSDTLSYAQLDAQGTRLARRLREMGVGPDVRVGVCLDRSPMTIVALLAVLKAGGAYVPLDPAYPSERLVYMAEDSRLRVAISTSDLTGLLPASVTDVVCLDTIAEGTTGEDESADHVDACGPDDLIYVTYTSGSTGRPKGVEITHRGVVRLLCNTNYVSLDSSQTLLQLAPLSFDASTFEVWGALIHGGRLVLYPDRLPQLEELAAVLQHHHVTTLWLTASLYNTAIDQIPSALAGVRQLLIGGEALSVAHVKRGLAALPHTRIINGYGPTESTTFTCCHSIAPDSVTGATPSIPIGRPITNTQVYILDAECELVPIGVPGELCIGGDGLARGYTNARSLTAERFVPNPFSAVPGARMYRTGDMVRWSPDGTIEFLGRRDGQVKIRGHRIELGEIEHSIIQYPGVRSAAVTIYQHQAGGKQLAAYFVTEPDARVDVEALRAFLKNGLPEYMVPVYVTLLSSLPLTPNGKIDRAALPSPTLAIATAGDGDGPRTAAEETLARIWAETLGVERVGVHDNFFDLGGDSILAIQIASRAKKSGVHLTPRHFFEHQTVAEQAALSLGGSLKTAQQDAVAGDVPFTPIQHWFFEQSLDAAHHFNQAVLLELRGPIDAAQIQQALDAVLRHHDALRTRFVVHGSEWIQHIDAAAEFPCTILDVSSTAEHDWRGMLDSESSFAQASLNLETGPLARAVLFKGGVAGAGRLLIVIHHLVVDAVSWRILLEDLNAALAQLSEGGTARFPSKTTSIKQWSEGLRALSTSDALATEEEFWRQCAASTAGRLPVDHVDPRLQNSAGSMATVSVEMAPDETEALLRAVPKLVGARIEHALLASVAVALSEWTGERDVCIDVEGHGREAIVPDVDLTRTVGWFTSIYPVFLSIARETSRDDFAAYVADRARHASAHGIYYGLVRYLGGSAEIRRELAAIHADISFNYLGQFDHILPVSGLLSVSSEPTGASVAPSNVRPYLLEVTARISGGVLRLDWMFSDAVHQRSTVERLAAESAQELRRIIEASHGRRKQRPLAGHFPLAAVDQNQVDAIAERYGDIDDILPLAPLQHGMVVHSLAAVGSGAFVTQIRIVIESETLTPDVLRDVWADMQRRHPVLRTAFVDVGGGELRQVVLAEPQLRWQVEDWRGVPEHEHEAKLHSFLEDRRRACAPDAGAFEVALLRLGMQRWHLVWTHHHALLDGWSVAMLLEEMLRLYESRARRVHAVADERPSYRDYFEWLMRCDWSASRDFWSAQLSGFRAPNTLSADRAPRARVVSADRIAEQELILDDAFTGALERFAARHRLTLNTLIQGAWAILVSRYSGDRDVVFGAATSGRPADLPGVERMVGLFLNGIPVRLDVDSEATAVEWFAAVQRRLIAVREHEHLPLSEVQACSDLPPGQPLFETTIAFENYPVAPALDAIASSVGVVDFKLVAHTSSALHLRVLPGAQLRLMLSHNRDRFDSASATEMLRQIETILAQVMKQPATALGDVSLVTSSSAALLPDLRVAPAVAWQGSVHERVLQVAERAAGHPAISHQGRTLSYGELDRLSNAVAAALKAAGVGREDIVGVYVGRSPALVWTLLGIVKAGAAFTILDPSYPTSRLVEQLAVVNSRVVAHAGPEDAHVAMLAAGQRVGERRSLISVDEASLSAESAPEISDRASADQLAYVAFTSGSTGRPKAILGRHAALAQYGDALRMAFGLGSSDRFSMLTALSHDPLLRDIFGPLQLGATICIPENAMWDSPGALARWAASEGVTVANLTPSMARLLLEGTSGGVIESLRFALFVGEPLPRTLVSRMKQLAPAVTCVNLYGSTETQQALAHYVVSSPHPEDAAIVPAGRGLPGVDLVVVRDDRAVAGIGEIGEVWMRSPLLARGYLDDPEQTALRFRQDPLGPASGRFYVTGDRGRYLPTGDVALLGRGDGQVKIRGHRVELADVETFLAGLPGIAEAAVAAVADPHGDLTLVAWVAADDLDLGALREHARERLPEYLVPAKFVRVDRLPRTAAGKIDRQSLPAHHGRTLDVVATAPRNPVEARLLELWTEILPGSQAGVDDNFFDAGGHSILAARFAARIRDAFSVELKIADIFRLPRVAQLAELVSELSGKRDEEVTRLIAEIQALSPEEIAAVLEEAGIPEGGAGS